MRCAVRLYRAKSISSHRNVCLELYLILLRAAIRKKSTSSTPEPLSLCRLLRFEKYNALYSVSQASTTHALARSLTAKCSHSTACVWDIIGKRLQSFKVAKENCFQLLS